jgi:hypothetical protein
MNHGSPNIHEDFSTASTRLGHRPESQVAVAKPVATSDQASPIFGTYRCMIVVAFAHCTGQVPRNGGISTITNSYRRRANGTLPRNVSTSRLPLPSMTWHIPRSNLRHGQPSVPPAISCLGAFRTPVAGARAQIIVAGVRKPAHNLHTCGLMHHSKQYLSR